MKKIIYLFIKIWIKTSLHLYYRRIKVFGLANIPIDKPVMFLPNHQNALLDPLLIAVDCNRKPYFLTRSDVFKSSILNHLFELVRMIPIYRIRDGRDSLKNNDEVFDKCVKLLLQKESLLMFPEANHGLKRQIRPLSKGFSRILFKAFEHDPNLDVQIVPVGLNYVDAENFPDEVAIYFGKPISAHGFYDSKKLRESVEELKTVVSEELKTLTIHIDSEESYYDIIEKLEGQEVDYLDPEKTNSILAKLNVIEDEPIGKPDKSLVSRGFRMLFYWFNFPIILIWKLLVKPKVPEPEFTTTFRFAVCVMLFPVFYLLIYLVLGYIIGHEVAIMVLLIHFVFNLTYVKLL